MIKRVTLLNGLFRLNDAAVIILAGVSSSFIKLGDLAMTDKYSLFLTVLLFLTINIFSLLSIYQGWQNSSLYREISRLSFGFFLVILLTGILVFFTKTGASFSREWVAWTFLLSYVGLICSRIISRRIIQHLQKSGYNQKRVVIVGCGELGKRACLSMQEQTWAGLIPIAFFDDECQEKIYNNVPVKGAIDESITFIEEKRKSNPVDQVWIALPLSAQKKIEKLQIALQDTATKIYFIPDLFGFNLASYTVDEMVGLPVMNMSAPPMSGWSATLKRIEDILVSFISLILLSPLFLIVSILIKKDSKGPVFFKQRRYGQDLSLIHI